MILDKNHILFILAPKVDTISPLPLSIPCLSAYLKEREWGVSVYDLNTECYVNRKNRYKTHWDIEFQEFWSNENAVTSFFNDSREEIEKMFEFIEKKKPAYIGFSTWITNFCGSVVIAREIKNKWPSIKLIFGGVEVWQKLQTGKLESDNYAFIDAFVIGEGEATLHELLRCLKNEDNISKCPGIAFFKGSDLHVTAPRTTSILPKELPLPDFSNFDLNKYSNGGKLLPLYMSRGCINKCIFCEERKYWSAYRTKSGKQLFEEIKQLKLQYPNFTHIYFSESLINGNIKELQQLCQLLIDSDIKIHWEANAVIRKEMNKDLLQLMAKAGCNLLVYGVETVSKKLLASVGKVMSNGADIETIIHDTAEAGIRVTMDFMFGLPGESEEDAQENIDFVIRNRKDIHTIYPSWSFCYLTQFSDAYADPERWGLKPITDMSFWESIDGTNTYPVRLERFEKFCSTMMKEGITTQYPSDKLTDREKKLGYYYCYKNDFFKATMFLLQAVEKEPWDTTLREGLKICCQKVLDEIEIKSAQNYTDDNWLNGVARSWAVAFFITNSMLARKIFATDLKITFADGDTRKILKTQEDNGSLIVFLDGAPLDGSVVGYPHSFTVHSC